MSLSKSQIKIITSLQQKKYRNKQNLFVVEGVKSVNEFLASNFILENLFYTEEYNITSFNSKILNKSQLVTNTKLKKISFLKTPNQVLAVFKIPKESDVLKNGLIVVLDEIKDPGNLGTIIRLCDWFDVKQLVCSLKTVDCYNPKVVQASMGSLARIKVTYVNLNSYLNKSTFPIFTADMNGDNIYKTQLPKNAIIIMGNEANGISKEVNSLSTHKISIPRFGNIQQTESLNVATATAIILSEFRR